MGYRPIYPCSSTGKKTKRRLYLLTNMGLHRGRTGTTICNQKNDVSGIKHWHDTFRVFALERTIGTKTTTCRQYKNTFIPLRYEINCGLVLLTPYALM